MDEGALRRCLEEYCAASRADEREIPIEHPAVASVDAPEALDLIRQELLKLDPERMLESAPEVVDRLQELEARRQRLDELRNKRGARTAHEAGFMLQPIEPHERGGLPKGLKASADDEPKRRSRKKKS